MQSILEHRNMTVGPYLMYIVRMRRVLLDFLYLIRYHTNVRFFVLLQIES